MDSTLITPGEVPFIGWSRTSHNFRALAARLAPGGAAAALFVGDPGVGKRTMARAWQHLSGGESTLPIIDLERNPGDLPGRCIGHSSRLPGKGSRCYLLGSGYAWGMPDSRPDGSVLPADVLGRFDVIIHVPPIRGHREFDVLAYLDYCARVRFPAAGYPFNSVELRLLRRILFGRDWPGNFSELGRFIESTARLNASAVGRNTSDEDPPSLADIPALSHDSAAPSGPEEVDRIDLYRLKDLAVAIYLARCRLTIDPGVDSSAERPPDDHVLLPDALWFAGMSVKPFLGHREFSELGIDDFVREKVLLGLRLDTQEQRDLYARLKDHVARNPVLGATFESLRSGFAMDPIQVSNCLAYQPVCPTPGDNPRGGAPASGHADTDGDSRGRFDYRIGRSFHIEFRLGDVDESAVYARQSSIGLAYYWLLLTRPGRTWSALELHSTVQELEKDGRPLVISKDEAEANRLNGGSVQEKVIDRETRDRALELQKATKGKLIAAKKCRDLEEIGRLEKELKQIDDFLNRATYQGRIKDLDRSQKAALENVGKALSRARAVIREDMPRLAHHLERHVEKNGASWVYRPPGRFHFEANTDPPR